MTASVARKEFGRYLDAAQREPVIITKKNRPVAVAVSFQDWEERIERSLSHGLEDIAQGRFEELSDQSTAARLARFKDRSSGATRR